MIFADCSTNYKITVMQDNGKGVILTATWLVPLLLIPRAWDYPEEVKFGDDSVVFETKAIGGQ
jgi:hypothetical protein